MGNYGGVTPNDREIRIAHHALAPYRFVIYAAGHDPNEKIDPPLIDGQSGCVAITDAIMNMDPVDSNLAGQYAIGDGVPCNLANDGTVLLEAGDTITAGDDITMVVDVDGLGGVGVPAATHAGFIYGKAVQSAVDAEHFLFEPRHLGA